jgi:3-isopropylmalate/(R)-2-methylmalate dehydratase large subunit
LGATATEKILARVSGRPRVVAGDEVSVRPDRIMTYDWPGWTSRFIEQQEADFGGRMAEADRYVIFIDHLVSRGDADEAAAHRPAVEWARKVGANLHEGMGIGHQVSAELGYAVPGAFLIHIDPHVSSLGAFGSLAIGTHRSMLEPWVTGELALTVPAVVEVRLEDELPPHVDGRDLLHHLIAWCGASGFLQRVVEVTGPGAESLSLGARQTICGMLMFGGALAGLTPVDAKVLDYVGPRARGEFEVVEADPDATYADTVELDLGEVEPLVAMPGAATPERLVPVKRAVGTPLSRGYIGSCSSGRIEELRTAAEVLNGRQLHPDFQLTILPTSEAIREQAEAEGLLAILTDAGAQVPRSSCDHCIGYANAMGAGETCISSGVLNVRGRMGSIDSEIYLASAETVAASALAGVISDPREPAAR